jgi:hypothetical protein
MDLIHLFEIAQKLRASSFIILLRALVVVQAGVEEGLDEGDETEEVVGVLDHEVQSAFG